MTDRLPLPDLAEALVDHARAAGAEEADALAVAARSLSIGVRGGRLEHAERSEKVEVGLRVIVDRRQALVSSSDITPSTLREIAERAVTMARAAPRDEALGLAEPRQLAAERDPAPLELCDPSAEPGPAALEELGKAAEAAALAVDGVAQVSEAGAGWELVRSHLAASNGFSGGHARTSHSLWCVAVAGEGREMQRDYRSESRVFAADMPPPEEIGRSAGERAAAMRGATRPPTGAFAVIFDERVAASLAGHLLAAINGDAIVRGASWLRDAMGEAVLPAGIDLVEEPHRRRIAASRLFDAEGLATRPRAFVENGVLRSWVLDLATGRRLSLPSTANAARSTSSPPRPAVTSIRLTEGTADRAALMREAGTGLLVTSLMGATINPNTGDYSRGASGFWFEDGEIVRPVHECTIAGNLREMLRSIRPANDADQWRSWRVPSLLVEGLTIAGE